MTSRSTRPIKQEQLESNSCLSSSPQPSPHLSPVTQESLIDQPCLASFTRSGPHSTLNIKSENQARVFDWDIHKMSDSDDSGPLPQQAKKRRRISSRSAIAGVREAVTSKTGGVNHQSSSRMFDNKIELDFVIAQVRARTIAAQKEIQERDSAEELKISQIRSALEESERQNQVLRERLSTGLEKSENLKNELLHSQKEQQGSKAATDGKKQKLAQALADIDSLSNLEKDIVAHLRHTAFESKDVSIMNMLEPLYREFFQKYAAVDGIRCSEGVAKTTSLPEGMSSIMRNQLLFILNELRSHQYWYIFAEPVKETDAPGYFEFIEQPMDLSTMKRKLEARSYKTLEDFLSDARLVFNNCRSYNKDVDYYVDAANRLEHRMVELMKKRGLT